MKKLKCVRCGHEWKPRIDRRPAACPKCNNRKWDEPRSKRSIAEIFPAFEKIRLGDK